MLREGLPIVPPIRVRSVQYGRRIRASENNGDKLSVGVQLPGGGRNTMAYRADNLRHQLADNEATKLMVWDELGYSGYIDVVQERLP